MLDIVIPAAGSAKRMKAFGPKSLIKLKEETVVARQLRLLKEVYPKSRITVVGGFEGSRLRRSLPTGVRFIENKAYENTNVALSVGLALDETPVNRAVLVVYGDLVFCEDVVRLPTVSSMVVGTTEGREAEVGTCISDGEVTNLSYGLLPHWGQIVMLAPREKAIYLDLIKANHRRNYLGYELLNEVIDQGGHFQAVSKDLSRRLFVELDYNTDIDDARLVA